MISPRNLGFIAALFEGEGSFMCRKTTTLPDGTVRKNGSIRMTIGMCDRDVIEHARTLMGHQGSIHTFTPDNPKHKPRYGFELNGRHAAEWMMTVYAMMGQRRRAQITRALTQWRALPVYQGYKIVCLHGHRFDLVRARKRGQKVGKERICLECERVRHRRAARKYYYKNRKITPRILARSSEGW